MFPAEVPHSALLSQPLHRDVQGDCVQQEPTAPLAPGAAVGVNPNSGTSEWGDPRQVT